MASTTSRDPLERLLDQGQLQPVVAIAADVFGAPVSHRTALRWSVAGRAGRRLPTVRGWNRQIVTTESAFRAWLAATSGQEPTVEPNKPVVDHAADAALAALSPRLARRSKRGTKP